MKVVFLNPSGELGGAERVLLDVLGSLREAEPAWSLHLVASAPGPLIARARALGVDASVLAFPRSLARVGDASAADPDRGLGVVSVGVGLARASLAVLAYRSRLRRLLGQLAPDVVHTNGFKMHTLGIWARPPGVPVVWHIHDYVSARRVMSRVLRLHARRCQAAIANSQSVAQDVARTCSGRVAVHPVYNAVDLKAFSPEGPRLDLDALSGLPPAPPGTVRVGLLATLARWKGHETFLRALSRLPPDAAVRGYVVSGAIYQTDGSQHALDELQALAARSGLEGRVGFTGFVDEPAAAMRALDVVVHASTRPEPFGLVITEAMACARAVVVSAAGGAAEIVTDGVDALTHTPGAADELAERIARLAADPALRAALGGRARETVARRFDRARLGQQVAPIYRQVAGPLGGGRRIVFLNPSGQLGGAERVLLDAMASLRSAQPELALHVVLGEDGPLKLRAAELGVGTTVLPFPAEIARLGDAASADGSDERLSGRTVFRRLLGANPSILTYLLRLRRVLRRLRPDLLHANGFKMHVLAVWARPRGVPVVWHVHEHVSDRRVMSRLLASHARSCSAAVANSESVAGDLRAVCGPALPVHTVYNGIDLEEFSPEGPAVDLDALSMLPAAPEGTVRVGVVAALGRWKGHESFLTALALLPEESPVRGYVIGEALYQTEGSQFSSEEFRRRAEELGIAGRVGFTGFLPEPARAMRALDIVVHASTRPEGFGLVIVEAMATGRPVIVTESGGGPAEIVTPGYDSLLHAPGDLQGMADLIARLAADPALREALGRAGRETAERRFDRTRLGAELLPIYAGALAPRQGRGQRAAAVAKPAAGRA